MAKKPGLVTRGSQGGLSELKSRLLFVLGAIIVFRAGAYVPIPGIDATVLGQLFQQKKRQSQLASHFGPFADY